MIILPLLAALSIPSHAVTRSPRDANAGSDVGKLTRAKPDRVETSEIFTEVEASPASDSELQTLPTQAQFWATELERGREQLGGETKAMQALGLTPPLFYKIKGLIGDTEPLPRDGSPVQSAKTRMSAALQAHLAAFGDPDKALDHFNWTPRYAKEALGTLGHQVSARRSRAEARAADEKAVARRRKTAERERSKAASERTSGLPTLQEFSQEQTIRQLVGIFSGNREKINAKLAEFAESRGSQWQPLSQSEIDTLRADNRTLAQRERDFLKMHLDAADGDYAAAAKTLGIVGEDGGITVVKNKLRLAGLLGR